MEQSNTILIVDDEALGREILEDMLVDRGYRLVFANSGSEALQKAAEISPDLILLDVMMPDFDGFEICQRLKVDRKWQHIPIIMVTALDATGDVVRGLEAGAEDFISKPVNGLELRARVRSMLRVKNQYDLLEKQRHELEASLHLNRKLSHVFAQHLEALEILHHAGLRLMDNLNMDSVLDLVAQTALELIPEAAGCVMHFLSGDELLPVTFSADYRVKMVQPSVGIEGIVRQAIETKQVIHLADAANHLSQFTSGLTDIRALLVTPLLDNQRAVGVLSVYSLEADAFEEGHNHILSILANQAAIAITKARVLREKELAKEREKWAIRNLFQRYVNPTVVERLVDGQESLALGGKRQAISVLFADIRGFTTFSEHLPPERVVEVLNQYLGLAVRAVLAEEGTLDKFMGDAIMAFFNAPLPQPDSTLRAVRAALAMQQAVAAYNTTVTDHQPLTFGIGIHFDQAVVGNIGTAQQMNYTAIGHTVNLAKRLEESAASGQIILSQAAYKAVKEFVRVEDLGPRGFKGHTSKEHAYALLGLR